MRLSIWITLFFFFVPSLLVNAREVPSSLTSTMEVSSIAGISSALSRADVALCKSVIYPPHLKGDYGETIVGKYYLEQHLKNSGSWDLIASRFGRQGIDQIYIKYDNLGRPRDLIVGEVKYGSSKLGLTQDGIQMGKPWVQKRLIKVADNYLNIGSSKSLEFGIRPSRLSSQNQIEINLGNGKKAYFWRESSRRQWKYDGPPEHLENAQNRAKITGEYLKKAGQGLIRIRRRIFQVKVKNNTLNLTIKDAKNLDAEIPLSKIKGQEINIKLNGASGRLSNNALKKEIAAQIKRKMPHLSDQECIEYAKGIVKPANNDIENIKVAKHAFAKSVLSSSLKAGIAGAAFAVLLEGATQLSNGQANYERLLGTGILGFSAVGTGSSVGQLTTAAIIDSKVAHTTVTEVASRLGVSPTFLSQTIGATAGAGITAVLFAYGGYFLGYYDSYTANVNAVCGLVGVGGGTLAATSTMALVSAYATAGTGTAISSLSGAAATNASLAWLGGGTIASGGGGIGTGAIALGGIVTVTALAVAATTAYCFSLYDNKQDRKLLELMLNDYCQNNSLRYYIKRLYPYQ